MSVYRITPAAQRDLSAIWDFTEERWDTSRAETYVREIQAAIERITADPRRGRSRNEVRHGYLSYAIGSHMIFYLRSTDGVDIIRVLHQRMDHSRHL